MQLYVEETGPQDAPGIVFLHGGGLSGRMWQPQVQELSDYHCIVPDLPEQGRSADIAPFRSATLRGELPTLFGGDQNGLYLWHSHTFGELMVPDLQH